MTTGFKNLVYIGNDKKFISNLKCVYESQPINLVFLRNADELKRYIDEVSHELSKSIVMIEKDCEPIGGLPCAIYLAMEKIYHLGLIVLSDINLDDEVHLLSDYFINSCGCTLIADEKKNWRAALEFICEPKEMFV